MRFVWYGRINDSGEVLQAVQLIRAHTQGKARPEQKRYVHTTGNG